VCVSFYVYRLFSGEKRERLESKFVVVVGRDLLSCVSSTSRERRERKNQKNL
jgi:hypothetical protein